MMVLPGLDAHDHDSAGNINSVFELDGSCLESSLHANQEIILRVTVQFEQELLRLIRSLLCFKRTVLVDCGSLVFLLELALIYASMTCNRLCQRLRFGFPAGSMSREYGLVPGLSTPNRLLQSGSHPQY
jgi:hypothetical protein